MGLEEVMKTADEDEWRISPIYENNGVPTIGLGSMIDHFDADVGDDVIVYADESKYGLFLALIPVEQGDDGD